MNNLRYSKKVFFFLGVTTMTICSASHNTSPAPACTTDHYQCGAYAFYKILGAACDENRLFKKFQEIFLRDGLVDAVNTILKDYNYSTSLSTKRSKQIGGTIFDTAMSAISAYKLLYGGEAYEQEYFENSDRNAVIAYSIVLAMVRKTAKTFTTKKYSKKWMQGMFVSKKLQQLSSKTLEIFSNLILFEVIFDEIVAPLIARSIMSNQQFVQYIGNAKSIKEISAIAENFTNTFWGFASTEE